MVYIFGTIFGKELKPTLDEIGTEFITGYQNKHENYIQGGLHNFGLIMALNCNSLYVL